MAAKEPAKTMTKDEMVKTMAEEVEFLKDHSASLIKLLDDLHLTMRPGTGDVSFQALEKSKDVLEQMSEARASVQKVRTTLKARAQARMKEG